MACIKKIDDTDYNNFLEITLSFDNIIFVLLFFKGSKKIMSTMQHDNVTNGSQANLHVKISCKYQLDQHESEVEKKKKNDYEKKILYILYIYQVDLKKFPKTLVTSYLTFSKLTCLVDN